MLEVTRERPRIGYVVKRYPRFSETFIVNEILAHERAGLDIDIFALRPPVDTHFQDLISRVRTGVTYLDSGSIRGQEFWAALQEAGRLAPELAWDALAKAGEESYRDVYQAAQLAVLIHERGITHLHAHFASSATSVARLAARMTGIGYSFTAHAKDIFHESVDPADLARKLRDASAVVTVSDFNLAHLREEFGPLAARVTRIYNGLDLEEFPFREPGPRPPRIVAVGRLVEKKGFDVLINAAAELRRRGVNFSVEIIGGGELEDELRARIERLGLGNLVEMTGPLPQPEVKRRIAGATVFAAPCVTGEDGNRDGLPTVLLEAMALGTPSVSTPVTGIPEVIAHGETGLLVREGDALMLARALELLLGDIELGERLARNARRQIEERFDIHQNAARLRALFPGVEPAETLAEQAEWIEVPA